MSSDPKTAPISDVAVAEAFRSLRNDDAVSQLPPGSQSRKRRIRELLDPIADIYGVSSSDLAMAVARRLS
jgi:hypothetical protein